MQICYFIILYNSFIGVWTRVLHAKTKIRMYSIRIESRLNMRFRFHVLVDRRRNCVMVEHLQQQRSSKSGMDPRVCPAARPYCLFYVPGAIAYGG